jgi:nitrogenase-associated protein
MEVVFYEKPGCINNMRQKRLLEQAGYEVRERNLLAERWNLKKLCDFLAPHPVDEWFNRSAPKIKNGDVVPERLSRSEAIRLLIKDPILIRRPLVKTDLGCAMGFDPKIALAEIGIHLSADGGDPLEACPRSGGKSREN